MEDLDPSFLLEEPVWHFFLGVRSNWALQPLFLSFGQLGFDIDKELFRVIEMYIQISL